MRHLVAAIFGTRVDGYAIVMLVVAERQRWGATHFKGILGCHRISLSPPRCTKEIMTYRISSRTSWKSASQFVFDLATAQQTQRRMRES